MSFSDDLFTEHDPAAVSAEFGRTKGLEGYDMLVASGHIAPGKTVENIATYAVRLSKAAAERFDIDERIAVPALIEGLEQRTFAQED